MHQSETMIREEVLALAMDDEEEVDELDEAEEDEEESDADEDEEE